MTSWGFAFRSDLLPSVMDPSLPPSLPSSLPSFGDWFCWNIGKLVKLFMAIAWVGSTVGGVQEICISWLFTILFKSWLSPFYICTHTYNVYGSVIAECIFLKVSFFSSLFFKQ